MEPFLNRVQAGRLLAEALRASLPDLAEHSGVIVLALPRGGVPPGLEVARALTAPLDVMLVRKLGVPGQPELAMGAITSGARVLNEDVIWHCGIRDEDLEAVASVERTELERRARRYRGDKPWPDLKDRCVILVDDGIATGATMEAAARAVREQQPAALVLAVPVAPQSTLTRFTPLVDRVVCLLTPEPFWSIGAWYRDFSQLTDEQVIAMLREADHLSREKGE
ncbi:phosphoribosyltransferase [Microbulbifer bruguierae]|uniref:Phosphoribosyltransferase n=1 Tax=Microbulbifer bruguierae TaxID=3029061 RepID=A0ABY8NF64_9GAMM|nr:phosphoribosyltransferase [Microbulbifer bruguierae]WGL17573.1 phosphoribosyltransferase [Microbulbifer bruguierae]